MNNIWSSLPGSSRQFQGEHEYKSSGTGSFTDHYESTRTCGIAMDTGSRAVRIGENSVRLTKTEYKLLHLFKSHPGRTVSRKKVVCHLWGEGSDKSSRTIDTCLCRLRKKLWNLPVSFTTIRGSGYRLELETSFRKPYIIP